MSKKTAHVVFIFFDLFALFGLWLGYNVVTEVVAGLSDSADTVSFSSRIGFFIFGIGLPIAHIYAICEHFFLQKIFTKVAAWVNGAFIILGIVFFAGAFFLSAYMRTYVERAGYVHCREADNPMTFSTYLMYTKNEEICRRLIQEDIKK